VTAVTTQPEPTVTDAPALSVGVLRESAAGERRVALTPDGVTRLRALGLRVLVELGAGADAWFPDAAYAAAGAALVDNATVYADSDVVVCVQPPDAAALASMHPGQSLIGLLEPLVDLERVHACADAKVSAISFDCLPRTLSNAQSMDVLTSQANVAGYKAAVLAADVYGSYFPMLMTAAGTVRPAKVLVLGAGVAGLQAIGTARRLGAVVTAYDVRDAARGDVASTGAAFLDLGLSASSPASVDGYARQQSAAEQQDVAAAMAKAIGTFDVVISTAQVPGRRPPVLVSRAALAALSPGSVVVDLASGPLGGNVEGSVPDTTVVTDNGVTLIGAGGLPASMPRAASTAYSRNVAALLAHLVHDGRLALDTADAITAGVLVTHDGDVVHPGVLALLTQNAAAATHPRPTATGEDTHR
jgi:H+-translocating NAD(P) transhydrogenase subunit alpha